MRVKVNVFWKIYFWFAVVTTFPSFLVLIPPRLWEFVELALFLVAAVGLYGFCWQKRVVSQSLWKFFLPCYVVWNVMSYYFIPKHPNVVKFYEFTSDVPPIMDYLEPFIFWVLVMPLFAALWLLGFRSKELWSSNE